LLEHLSTFQVRREQVNRVYVSYQFSNIGRTPAIVENLYADFTYSDKPPSAPSTYDFPKTSPLVQATAYRSGGEFAEEFSILASLNFVYEPLVIPQMEDGRDIYLVMLAKYTDLASRSHETSVCRVYKSASDGFVAYDGDEYNYAT
jgi:hypothetical protein